MTAAAIGVFIIMLLIDLPRMLREKKRRELAVFAFFAVIALVYMLWFAICGEAFSIIRSLSEFTAGIGLNYELWQGHS